VTRCKFIEISLLKFCVMPSDHFSFEPCNSKRTAVIKVALTN